MRFSSAVSSWTHLLCEWSMSDALPEADYRYYELRMWVQSTPGIPCLET